jgi:GGDEF domain-containing protein
MLFALIGIKNYRQIFEKFGTQGVNEALNAVTARLEGFYGENTVVGKTGLNEFVIFADYTDYDLTKAHERLTAGFERLEEVLKDCDFSDGEGRAECCAGAAVYPDISSDYDELYESAKASLEEALQGENRYILREKPFAFKGGE